MFSGLLVIYFGTGDEDTIIIKYKQQQNDSTLGFILKIKDEYLTNLAVANDTWKSIFIFFVKKSLWPSQNMKCRYKDAKAELGHADIAIKTQRVLRVIRVTLFNLEC